MMHHSGMNAFRKDTSLERMHSFETLKKKNLNIFVSIYKGRTTKNLNTFVYL